MDLVDFIFQTDNKACAELLTGLARPATYAKAPFETRLETFTIFCEGQKIVPVLAFWAPREENELADHFAGVARMGGRGSGVWKDWVGFDLGRIEGLFEDYLYCEMFLYVYHVSDYCAFFVRGSIKRKHSYNTTWKYKKY